MDCHMPIAVNRSQPFSNPFPTSIRNQFCLQDVQPLGDLPGLPAKHGSLAALSCLRVKSRTLPLPFPLPFPLHLRTCSVVVTRPRLPPTKQNQTHHLSKSTVESMTAVASNAQVHWSMGSQCWAVGSKLTIIGKYIWRSKSAPTLLPWRQQHCNPIHFRHST